MPRKREADKPLWKSGSHVERRSRSAGSTTGSRSSRPPSSRSARSGGGGRSVDYEGLGDVDEWIRSHPADTVHTAGADVPSGEIEAKTSGVFGVYGDLPQVTVRLFEKFLDTERDSRGSTRVNVPRPAESNALLGAALALPIVTHHFA